MDKVTLVPNVSYLFSARTICIDCSKTETYTMM